jgi:ATP-dependent Clp endopeptidase proteolytic subunit ClpP
MTTKTARSWYEIRNAASADVAEVFIYEQIGEDWFGGGVTAKNFASDLAAVTAPNIDLHLNSPGGLVFDGQAIHNALVRHPAAITVYIDGLAASIASVIALAGDRIVMASNALFMIHDPAGGVWGPAADMRKMAEVLDKIKATIIGVYQAKTGADAEELAAAMTAETWYTAEEALAAGFVDEIGVEVAAKASFDLTGAFRYRNVPDALNGSGPAADGGSKIPGQGGSPVPVPGGAPEPVNVETWVPGLGFVKI